MTGSGRSEPSSPGCCCKRSRSVAICFVRQQFAFYSVAVVFGFAYAGIMPLYAVLVRENFPLPIIGSVVGAASMASSLGMALGPLAGGVIFDTYGTYGCCMWHPSCSGLVPP